LNVLARPVFTLVFGACTLAAALVVAPPVRADTFKLIVTETETPLVPNSVADLAIRLGYYKRAGVDVELVRVQQTPSAVAALRSGEGDMANIATDTALQLVARDQMKLKGDVSPDKALPFLIAAKKAIATPKDLDGKIFGVARVGSADYILARAALTKLGVAVDTLQYLSVGQPAVRAQSLLAGQIDATAISIGIWLTIPDKSALTVVLDQPTFYRLAPFVSKLNVVTAEVAKTKAKEVAAVVRGIIMASRDFAKNPEIWVDAMAQARPDIKRADLEALGQAYRKSWSVNGGLDIADIKFTTDTDYTGPDFKGLRPVEPAEWIDTSFIDGVLKDVGTDPTQDETGR
jgi:NitT/TauT family transport system substrate-binding protein